LKPLLAARGLDLPRAGVDPHTTHWNWRATRRRA
jgi:hypothetical protein